MTHSINTQGGSSASSESRVTSRDEQGRTTKKRLIGEVVSDKMAKTVVIKVTVLKKHPKYHKQYTRSQRYKAHDENAEYHMGDVVEIEESRPLSKDKKWKVIKKIK